jgi:hypothetical protein
VRTAFDSPARRLAVLAVLVLLFAAAPRARAGTEQFSTFTVVGQEQDDESLLDHYLTRSPLAWEAEWSGAPLAIRTSQGCLTSGQWFMDTDIKLRASMGDRAWLGVHFDQSESDILSYDYLDLEGNFPLPVGTLTAMFRPLHDKARQDFGLSWTIGADTSAYQLRATFTFEDIFNNFWAFRQTQVGGLGEPYSKRPYEPALRFRTRHHRWRAEVAGQWLTSSSKEVVDLATVSPLLDRELWGVEGHAIAEIDLAGTTIELRGANRQARDRDLPIDASAIAQLGFRRQWSAEFAARRFIALARGTTVEARYVYQGRTEYGGAPAAQSVFHGDDRMVNLDASVTLSQRFIFRAGGLFDRAGVGKYNQPAFTFGTRNESRAYLGLIARFGKVSVQGIEGIELDPEPYEVSFHHDKGFLQLQTTF